MFSGKDSADVVDRIINVSALMLILLLLSNY